MKPRYSKQGIFEKPWAVLSRTAKSERFQGILCLLVKRGMSGQGREETQNRQKAGLKRTRWQQKCLQIKFWQKNDWWVTESFFKPEFSRTTLFGQMGGGGSERRLVHSGRAAWSWRGANPAAGQQEGFPEETLFNGEFSSTSHSLAGICLTTRFQIYCKLCSPIQTPYF